jgi:hypothetical protein
MSATVYQPSADFVKNAHISGMPAYQALCKEAETDYEGYWARLAKEFISWKTPFTKVLDESKAPFFKWFEDGTLNASYNCLDRNVEKGLGNKTALIFEADGGEITRITYSQLPMDSNPSVFKKATASSSTFPCPLMGLRPCKLAPALAPHTPWCSVVSQPSHCAIALKIRAPKL